MGSQPARDFTKVVIRQLPPTLQEADCKAAIDKEFADRYSWFSFARGKVGCVTCMPLRRHVACHVSWCTLHQRLAAVHLCRRGCSLVNQA